MARCVGGTTNAHSNQSPESDLWRWGGTISSGANLRLECTEALSRSGLGLKEAGWVR